MAMYTRLKTVLWDLGKLTEQHFGTAHALTPFNTYTNGKRKAKAAYARKNTSEKPPLKTTSRVRVRAIDLKQTTVYLAGPVYYYNFLNTNQTYV